MAEEKRNRIIAAITVNIILLIAVFAIICIYQMVEIATINKLKKDMQNQIDYYNAQIKIDEDTLNYYKSEDGLLDKAYEWGFKHAR